MDTPAWAAQLTNDPVGFLRAQSQANAPWLHPAPGEARPALTLCWAAAALYGLNWGISIVRAIVHVVGLPWGRPCPPELDGCHAGWLSTFLSNSGHELTEPFYVLLGCLLILHALRIPDIAARPRAIADWGWEALAGLGWFFVLHISLLLAHLLTPSTRQFPYPTGSTPAEITLQLLPGPLGGAVEEIWFGPVFITLMRRRGWSWRTTLLVAAVLRWAFHLYYGAPSWAMALWGLAAAGLYILTGKWWTLFVLHALHDLCAVAENLAPTAASIANLLYLIAMVSLVSVLAAWAWPTLNTEDV